MSLNGLIWPVFPPVSYSPHEHWWVKQGGARLTGSDTLAKGWRAGSKEAKKQLQKLLIVSYPHGWHSRGAGISPKHSLKSQWRMHVLHWALDTCVGQWYLHHLLAGWCGSLTSALPYIGFVACGSLLAKIFLRFLCFPATILAKGGRQTPSPATSSLQCYFKDKHTSHCKGF